MLLFKYRTRKNFLILLISFFIALLSLFIVAFFLSPKLYGWYKGVQIEKIKYRIEEDSKDFETEEDLINSIYEFSIKSGSYSYIKSNNDDEFVWGFLSEPVMKEVFSDNSNTVDFLIKTNFGEYRIYLANEKHSTNLFSEMFISITPTIFLLLFLIAIITSVFIYRNNTKPLVRVIKNLEQYFEDGTPFEVSTTTLDDEFNHLEKMIKKIIDENENTKLEYSGDADFLRKKEAFRNERYMIISHELKTPLTVLRLKIECMINKVGDYKNRDKHLVETLDVIEDIESITVKILEAIKLDYEDINLSKKKVAINDIIKKELQDLDVLMDGKNLDVDLHMKYVENYIDYDQFSRAIRNIFSNAVKYAEVNSTIEIFLDEDELIVKNSNLEVEDEDLNNVFQLFERVDKSRSKDTGGTGIGLYIVAEILERHNFGYEIKKVKDKVVFTITF